MARRPLTIAIAAGVAAFAGAQLVPVERTNPPTEPRGTLAAVHPVPPDVAALLKRSCNDCHSHETVWPWYSHVAPVSWWLSDHVQQGRQHLNLSTWGAYEPKRRRKLVDMCDQVRSKEMPLPSYLWLHPSGRLSEADQQRLCDWTKSVSAAG
jgi:hypothetical protein